jgi:hypothetical protein
MAVILGVDPGRAPDRFAMAVVEEIAPEVDEDGGRRGQPTYVVRGLERTPLGSSYPQSVARLVEVFDWIAAINEGREELCLRIDSTGVGAPVVDLVRDALEPRRRWQLTAVTFTSTDRIERSSKSEWRVGKAHMVSRLQVLLQQRLVKLPPTDEAKALARELLDYEVRVSETAALQAGAFRTGTHDDLATALGLSVLESGRREARSVITAAAFAGANSGLDRNPNHLAGDGLDIPLREQVATGEIEIGWGGAVWERRR